MVLLLGSYMRSAAANQSFKGAAASTVPIAAMSLNALNSILLHPSPSLPLARQSHASLLKCGIVPADTHVSTKLLSLYSKCGALPLARQLFDLLPHPNVFAWSSLLSAHARLGLVRSSSLLLLRMKSSGINPNSVTYNGLISGFKSAGIPQISLLAFRTMLSESLPADAASVSTALPAAGDSENISTGTQIHAHSIKAGLTADVCVASAVIDMYGKCWRPEEMLRAFEDVRADVGSCNAVIAGLSRNGLADRALDFFGRFRHDRVALNVVSWTSIVSCCGRNGREAEALELFREMQAAGVRPNSVTIPCVLPACANVAALTQGRSAHCFALRSAFADDVYVGSALVDMYAKCGRIEEGRAVFDRMPSKNVVSWNAMVGGYAMHGKGRDAVELFRTMETSGHVRPDFITFTCVLSACSQAGLTKEGQYYFDKMEKDFGLTARMEHYACMVSLLGRSGKLEDAYALIRKMPFHPDACVWGTLLSSCRVHGNLSLDEIATEKLFALEPANAGNYVLLSNIYATKGMWDAVDDMRDRMKLMGVKKDSGCSWIEIKNRVYMLLAGDRSHRDMDRIIERLEKMNVDMRKLGYSPSTDFVLQDVDEQEKEQILCGHSEKLALAFGLIHTSPGTSLRIIKNLRICGDCHLAMKFVSTSEAREIFVRDTNRFHHFKNGVCSCGDY